MSIKWIIFADDKKLPLNKKLLIEMYQNGPLQNAEIFAELFKLSETHFKKEEMFQDENGFITICKFLDIKSTEWDIFITFLKFGKLKNVQLIDFLISISNKFGCIPSIDQYYQEILNQPEIYNPQSPEEDIKHLYKWKTYFLSNNDHDYSFTKITHDKSNYGIYRKLKT